MKKKIITLVGVAIFSLAFTQVGINTANPTQTLDVNGTARLRNLVDIDGTDQSAIFNRKILSDANGVLGYVSNVSKAVFGLNDISQGVMTNYVSTNIQTGNVALNLSNSVIIPPMTDAVIVVDYNIPAYKTSGETLYIGVTLVKSTNGGNDQELDQGSRKYAMPGSFSNISGTFASGQGFPIAGKAIDRVRNNTNSAITVIYKPLGYVETNRTTIYFGMWSNTGAGPNYNWGRGSMTTTSYFKAL